jgi:hypothetical protein
MPRYQTGNGDFVEVDPMSEQGLRQQNRQQLLSDVLRNAKGVPEVALTMGTSLADMAGSGLGTLAGMAAQKFRGEKPDLDAATETMQAGKFTYAPRTEGGQETLRGLGAVTEPLEKGMQYAGQKTADVTGSPAAGAAVYTALNVLDPELLAPGAAKVAALRGGQRVAREAARGAVPMGEALRNVPQGQRGAYTLEDLSAVEGDFEFKSPTLQAFDSLKPQEQGRVTGKQLGKALQREGAKKEELSWMGLDDIVNSDEIVNAADVRKIAETNAPEFDYTSARSGTAGGELDDDAINEAVSNRVYEDDDLNYPVTVYRGTGRNREQVDTFDTQREADAHIRELQESYVDDNLESEIDYHLEENLENAFSEEELAGMTDNEKRAWAEEQARESLQSSAEDIEYGTEPDYDSDPVNLDAIRDYWEEEIRRNPGDYGIEGAQNAPAYGQYTVGGKGGDSDYNYTVSAGRLKGEERFGKGRDPSDTPEFLAPYLNEDIPDPSDPQRPLFTAEQATATPSKAFQIEALRRKAREADPNIEQFRAGVDKSHYDELGSDQMYFTRETDRPAPEWGSVQEGVGRAPGSTLKGPTGEALPQREGDAYPMRLVEETQSDWLQRGRKTGWADPKGLEKIAKEDADMVAGAADEKARVEGFQRQALDELPTALADDRIASFITNMREQVAASVQLGTERPHYADRIESQLLRFEETNQRNPNAYSLEDRQQAAHEFFRGIYNASDSGTPTEAFADQVTRSLERLPQMTESPISNKPTPSAPMRETRQYTQLSMADALRRAVQEGQQYLAWTPGDVHTKRWGTDTFQYAAVPENPRLIRYSGYDTSTEKSSGKTGLENLQGTAEELLKNDLAATIDLDAPNIDEVLQNIVKQQLDYGMHEYRKPDVQRKKRAAQLKKDLEAASKAAQAGERKAGHYSPRAMGYDLAYEPTAEDIITILRRAGVKKLPEIRDIPNPDSPRPLRGFEIDPEVAQAAKRGLPLPY